MNDHLRLYCRDLEANPGELVHKQAGVRLETVCGINFRGHIRMTTSDPVSCSVCRLGTLTPADVVDASVKEPGELVTT